MKDVILSSVQTKAIKSIPKYGEVNPKALGIKPNTLKSLINIGLVRETVSGYVKRAV